MQGLEPEKMRPGSFRMQVRLICYGWLSFVSVVGI